MMNIPRTATLMAMLILSVGATQVRAADTFEAVGVIEELSRANGVVVVDNREYFIPRKVLAAESADTTTLRSRLQPGQLVEMSGQRTGDGRLVVGRITILRQQETEAELRE